jgi:hypothetical protein
MGLDMYLSARRYVSGGWSHESRADQAKYDGVILTPLGLDRETLTELNGGSFSTYAEVSREALEKLLGLCNSAIATRLPDPELKPVAGSFFGSTVVDDYFWEDIEHTIKVLEYALSLDEDFDFIYHSSW